MSATRVPDVKSAIQLGDVHAELLATNSTRANELIGWGNDGEIRTHPLHYVSDMLFDGTLERGREIPLIEALLEAGANPNCQAANGETALIGASLGAEEVGLMLLDAGARLDSRGI
jgi:ankyrin repeat protein